MDPLFKAFRIFKLNDMYQALLFTFDYITNKLPLLFANTFQFNRDPLDLRSTRQADMIHIVRCPLQFGRRLPLYVLPEIWNKQLRSQMNVNNLFRFQFKYQIKVKYLNNYQSHVRCTNVRCLHMLPYSMILTWFLIKPPWSNGSVLNHRSLPPVFESRRGRI